MCNKREFNSKVKKYRELKLAKEAIEAQMNDLKEDIVEYVIDHGESSTDSTIYVRGDNFKVSYVTVIRENLDKNKLKAVLGDGYSMYVIPSSSHQLRVS